MFYVRFALLQIFSLFFYVQGDLYAQNEEHLSGVEARKLYSRVADLMEANSIASPELARAGAPLVENVRQAAHVLSLGNTREHAGVQYRLLTNAHIYLQIADAVPKSRFFLKEVGHQMEDLRQSIDKLRLHFQSTLELKERLILGSDRDQISRYTENNAQLDGVGLVDSRIIFLGDSITDNWPLNQYFPNKPYVNRGINGQVTSQMLARMQSDVINLHPAAVVILGGTNDLKRGVPFETIKNNFLMIASLASNHSITPIFASLLPVNDYNKSKDPNYEKSILHSPRDILLLNVWIRDFCSQRGFKYLDYHSKMTDSEGQLRMDLTEDGLHPNGEGYKIMGPLAEATISLALKSRVKNKRKKRLGLF